MPIAGNKVYSFARGMPASPGSPALDQAAAFRACTSADKALPR